jgi:short-subunit dehydrogenase
MAEKRSESGHVLITGASAGIGSEFARIFASEGFDLVLLARSRDKLRDLAQELQSLHGVKVTVIPADLSDPGAPQAVFDSLREHGIAVEILVNNAGVMAEGQFAALPVADHLHLLQINTVALTAMTGLFLEPMVSRGHGRILNVASVAAFFPVPGMATYGASKAYVRSFSEALSEELKGSGVTVTVFCPGFTDTDMMHASARAMQLPSLMVMDAKAVAKEGYSACLAGEVLHVAGVSNDLVTLGVQYLPRSLVRAIGGLVARQWS